LTIEGSGAITVNADVVVDSNQRVAV